MQLACWSVLWTLGKQYVIVLLLCSIFHLPYRLIPEKRLFLYKQITIIELCFESPVSDVCNIAGFLLSLEMYRVENTLQVWRNYVIIVRIDARSGVSTGESFFLDAQAFPYRLGLKSKACLSQNRKIIYHKTRVWILKKVATWHIYCCQLEILTYSLQVLATEKPEHYVFVNSNWCTPVPNKKTWSVVVSSACELMGVFAVVVYLVGTVYKFDFGLLKWKPNQWQSMKTSGSCDKD